MPRRSRGGGLRPFRDPRLIRRLAFWIGHRGEKDPELVPKDDPREKKRHFECPWPKFVTYENLKRVADYWCMGDCERARRMAPSLFNEVLAVVVAKEEGRAIRDEEDARDIKTSRAAADMRAISAGA